MNQGEGAWFGMKKGLVWNLDEKTSDCMDWNESQKYGTGIGTRPTWILVIESPSRRCTSASRMLRLNSRYLIFSERGSTFGSISSASGASMNPSP